ncbi:MAG TPA: MerC domain-containing protein [Planctomycetaceae bacterium]|nr:MerC domain-containing protein [Planctomycetaceae bacterium]
MQELSASGDAVVQVAESATASTTSVVPDWLGVTASVGCAIHCAAMPFVITFLPMLGLSFLADEAFHQVMVVVCAGLALLAFVPGWRLHRNLQPAIIAVSGLSIIGLAAFGLEDSCACCTLPKESQEVAAVGSSAQLCTDDDCEHCAAKAAESAADDTQAPSATDEAPVLAGFIPWITPLGGLFLIIAHLVNHRLSSACRCCTAKPSTTA